MSEAGKIKPYKALLKNASHSPSIWIVCSLISIGGAYATYFIFYNLKTGTDIDTNRRTKYMPWEEVKPTEQRNMFTVNKEKYTNANKELVEMREMLGKLER